MDLKEAAEKHSGQAQDSGRARLAGPGLRTLLPSECGRLQPSEVESHRGGSVRGQGEIPKVRGVFPVLSFPALAACKQMQPGVRRCKAMALASSQPPGRV